MRLRADVKEHSVEHLKLAEPVYGHNLSLTKWVEISEKPDGVYLFHYNASGECIADTWHLSIDEARAQAEFEFKISKSDWREMDASDRNDG